MLPSVLAMFMEFQVQVYVYISKKLLKDNITPPKPFFIKVTSAFRCNTHNESKEVGSNKYSYHPRGMAIDVRTPNELHVLEFYEIALGIPGYKEGGIGVYPWGLHLDTRDTGFARWFAIKITQKPR